MARWRCGATPRGGTAPDGPVTQHRGGAACARVSELVCALGVLADKYSTTAQEADATNAPGSRAAEPLTCSPEEIGQRFWARIVLRPEATISILPQNPEPYGNTRLCVRSIGTLNSSASYEAFRGRMPTVDALLRNRGLSDASDCALMERRPGMLQATAHSAESSSACLSTVSVASSCLSGGYL